MTLQINPKVHAKNLSCHSNRYNYTQELKQESLKFLFQFRRKPRIISQIKTAITSDPIKFTRLNSLQVPLKLLTREGIYALRAIIQSK